MRAKLVVLMVIVILFTIFVLQNTNDIIIKLYLWEIRLPAVLFITITLLIGIIIGMIASSLVMRKSKTSQIPKDDKNPPKTPI